MCSATETVLSGKYIVQHASMQKEKTSQTKDFSFYLNKLEKEMWIKFKVSWREINIE